MEKNVGDGLPDKEIFPHQDGDEAKDMKHFFPGKLLQDKGRSAGDEQVPYHGSHRTPEGDVQGTLIPHEPKKTKKLCWGKGWGEKPQQILSVTLADCKIKYLRQRLLVPGMKRGSYLLDLY